MAAHAAETLKRRRVLVTGASSQIGVFAIPRLLEAGFHVVAVSRQPWPENLPQPAHLEWLGLDQALQAQANNACQYLLSAGPMSLAVQVLRSSQRFDKAVIFSSSSVLTKHASEDPAEKQLIQTMRVQEVELASLADQQQLKMVIFRPTLIYGCGLDQNISRLAGLIKRYGVMPVNGSANGLRQPVHADDLAQVAVSAFDCQQELPLEMLLSGGSALSYADMVKAIFAACQKPARILHLPQWLLVAAIRLLKPLGLTGGVSAAMVKRQLLDLTFDSSRAQQLLDFQPRPFAPTWKDFELPACQQQATDRAFNR